MNNFLKGIAITAVILIPSYILFLVYMLNKKDPNANIIDPNFKGILNIQDIYSLPEVNRIDINKFQINKLTAPSNTINEIIIYNISWFKLMINIENVSDNFKLFLKDEKGNLLNIEYKLLVAKTIEASINMENNLEYNKTYYLVLEDNDKILNNINLFISSEDKKV